MTKVKKKLWLKIWTFSKLNFLVIWKTFFNSSSEQIKTAFSTYINYNVIKNGIFLLQKGFLKNFKPFCQIPSLKCMAWTTHCFQTFTCSDNFPPCVIEILMKYSLFFLRVFAHNLRNIKCLLWVGACEIIYNLIFLNNFNTGTISVKEWSLNVIISVFSSKQHFPHLIIYPTAINYRNLQKVCF